jgi:hypothetical protein
LSRRLGLAKSLYREWHQKDPTEAVEATFDFPEEVVVVGKAQRVVYASDKWEKEIYLYEHDFDSHPEVYMVAKKGVKHGDAVNTKHLLGVKSFKEALPLPILATTQELTFLDGSKPNRTVFGRRQPLLCSTLDKRTLVIFDFPRVIFIRGGSMRVTERGIVN